MEAQKKLNDRYFGYLLGLAVGDALGTTLEFRRPGTFRPIRKNILMEVRGHITYFLRKRTNFMGRS
jgi:ADP-ribosylglycohydrolase